MAESRLKLCDVVLFFQELDLLKVRLDEHYEFVDRFFIVESTRTFSNRPKPLHFLSNRHLFARWSEKIEHVVLDGERAFKPDDRWYNERLQRGYVLASRDVSGFDYILQLDCDEVIDRRHFAKVVDLASSGAEKIAPRLQLSFYWINLVAEQPWVVPRIFKITSSLRPEDVSDVQGGVPTEAVVGHHFSYLGGPESVRLKIQSFSHAEYDLTEFTDLDRIQSRMRAHVDPFDRIGSDNPHGRLEARPFGDWLPPYIQEHRSDFARYEWRAPWYTKVLGAIAHASPRRPRRTPH